MRRDRALTEAIRTNHLFSDLHLFSTLLESAERDDERPTPATSRQTVSIDTVVAFVELYALNGAATFNIKPPFTGE